jgi:sec-independent protein translocase protein TatA
MQTIAFFENLFRGPDLIILLALGLLIFGKRLPEVGRGLGRSIVEFRKGMKGIQDEVEDTVNKPEPPKAKVEPPARPPLTSSGEDARVSRADKVEAGPSEPSPMP